MYAGSGFPDISKNIHYLLVELDSGDICFGDLGIWQGVQENHKGLEHWIMDSGIL